MRRNMMTRLVRLNEVQYAETEHQIAGLVAQGFVPVPLEVAEKIVEAVVAASDTPKKSGGNKGNGKGANSGKGKDKGEKIDEGGAEDNPSPEGDEQH
jgi:hypothetical protein